MGILKYLGLVSECVRESPLQQLGLGLEDYAGIARNVGRVLNLSEDKWRRIRNRANKELSAEVRTIGLRLNEEMCNDRMFYDLAGLEYCNGPPVQGCFITALADYLLRKKDELMTPEDSSRAEGEIELIEAA